MRESELLSHIFKRSGGLAAAFPHVLVGPGDDCAVVASPSGDPILLKVDQVVEGRHFRPFPATPVDLIARKAMARSVSDIAAMGGTPTCAVVGATLPKDCAYANDLFDAMARWATGWGCPLVGGDIAVAETGPLMLAVTVLGTPHARRGPVLRSGAKAGDAVYVTGQLGGSLDPASGLGHHLTFEPRLREARTLCDGLGADLHALMDISDGLGRDAGRMAAASRVRIEIDGAAIPRRAGVAGWREAASEGEDYELLFAVPDGRGVPALAGVAWTRIGLVVPGSGCVILDGGRVVEAGELGWDHGE